MKTKFYYLILVAILIIAGVIYYNRIDQGEEKATISAVLPLTGASANIGKWQKNAIELAVEEHNSKSNKKIKLVIEDSNGDPKNGVNAFKKIIATEKTNAFLISLSGVANALTQDINKEKKKSMLLAVSLPDITSKSDYTYRFNLGSEDEAISMSDYMLKNNYKSVSLVYLNDEFGVGAVKSFKERFEKNGGKINLTEAYNKEQSDFKSIIAKLKSTKNDGIYVIGYVPSSVELIKQMRQLNLSNQVFANMALSVPSFLKSGGDALNGVIYTVTNFSTTDNLNLVSKNFTIKYNKKFKENPTFFSAFAYDATNILLKDLNDSSIKINNYKGVMGNININSNRNFIFPIKLVKNENGSIIDL